MLKLSLKAKIIIPVLLFALFFSLTEGIIFRFFGNSQTILFGVLGTVCLIALAFTLILIHVFITKRLMRLSRDLDRVRDPKNPNGRLDTSGTDEFTEIAKKVNQLLDDSEKFKLAIENTSDHVVITDADTKILYANKAAEMLTGYTLQEMIGNTPRLWMQDGNVDKVVDTAVNGKKAFHAEVMNKRKNGELYPTDVTISPILDEKANVKFYIGIHHDMSAEKELKETLIMENQQIAQKIEGQTKIIEDEKAKLLGLIDSISLGFIMFDNNGQVSLTNPAVERITGLRIDGKNIDSVDALLGKEFAVKEKFQKCLQDRQQVTAKNILFNNRYLRLLVSPIFSSQELMALIGIAVLIEDNTEVKTAERSRDEFFSIASHELRTPLTAIRGNTALLKTYKDKLDSKEVDAMIDDISSASVRLIGIVNDFLDTSMLETGKMAYKKESVNLVELAQEAIREYQTTGSLKMLYLTLVPPLSPLENVIGDKDRVKQILMNLVGNGVKYTDKGGVIITLERDNGFIKVLVTDTGKGIPPEIHKGLFNKFHEGPNGETYTRDVIHGTGLGLYISRMMAEGMGGKIALEKSVIGVGSTFSFELPMAKEATS